MSRMWHGPSRSVREAHADPVFGKIAHRLSRHDISFSLRDDGLSASVSAIVGKPGNYAIREISTVTGPSPYHIVLALATHYTPLDQELLSVWLLHLERQIAEIVELGRQYDRLDAILDTLAGVISVAHGKGDRYDEIQSLIDSAIPVEALRVGS